MSRNLNWALDPRKPRRTTKTTAAQVSDEQTSTTQSQDNTD